MLFNHLHIPVWNYKRGDASLCPLCSASLIARKGEIVVWHWAHHPRPHTRVSCAHEESPWHLKWKFAYLSFRGWEIEQPLVIDGKRYIVDAVNIRTGRIREFVHSLSPYYLAKHKALSTHSRFDVRWLIDGYRFVGRRQRELQNNGIKRLLIPRAFDLAEDLGEAVRVHWAGQLWRHWQRNIWYPDSAGDRLLDSFVAVDRKSEEGGTEC